MDNNKIGRSRNVSKIITYVYSVESMKLRVIVASCISICANNFYVRRVYVRLRQLLRYPVN